MRIVAVSIDEYIFKHGGEYYLDNVGFDIVKRYADNFDKVNLISRVMIVGEGALGIHNKLLDFKNVECFEVPFFQTLNELSKVYKSGGIAIGRALESCDAALVRSPSILGFWVLNRMKKTTPFALEVVANPYEMAKQYTGMRKIQSFVMHVLLKHYCKKAKALAFVTKSSQQGIYELNADKENNTSYSSIELKKDFFSAFSLEYRFLNGASPLKITHVSNVIVGDIKGHLEVLQVASKIKDLGKSFEITFVGDGPEVEYYKKLAEKSGISGNVDFIGFVDKEKLRSILLYSDFFLFPSKSEGLPKVLIEAMAVSVPCIASNVGGIPELLPDENLFECTDVDGMARRIVWLSENKEEYIANAQLMYETALEYESTVLNERRRIFYSRLIEK